MYPSSQFSIVAANSDDRVKEVLNIAKGLLTDIQRSPYRDRMFVLLDSVHSSTLPDKIVQMGVPRENVILWEKNGIEYYYPPSIMDAIFGTGSDITIVNDSVSRNGIVYKKWDLVERVINLMRNDTPLHPDFTRILLQPIETVIKHA